ncbi:ricin-type beta-trefoil lectin domain protein [Streptomyces dioscori]|uniref:Ricin-type beta-trefoil lectin domain protein n=1 Tax=Streptomyces dioscori TaxID=2109333 RepID=A0A2P8QD26_9ACTN|nr:RICIN domain-containing protein [Streptomyces dioscori]PSM44157.1 ricin-type beta-trefoil lectin domain protein [Streptomyces dioscori]
MARGEGDDDRPGAGVHTGASDARLTELLRADSATRDAALYELRARHRPAVLAYARLCTTGEYAARDLTAHAFTLAARETERGTDPRGPWRHQLLLLAWRLAAAWAGDQRSRRLDPGLLARLHEAGPGGPTPPMLDAFRSLPTRVQGLIWYGLVEREPEDETAGLLGVTRQDVTYGLESSLQALRATFLKSHLAASGDPRCQDFRRLIEESVRPDHPRHSADLRAHLAECGHCATAYEVLSALRDDRRTALAEGLLPWGGTAYAATLGPGTHAHADAHGRTQRTHPSPWPPSRRFVLTSAALGVALAPLLLFLVPSQEVDGRATPPRPPVTVTATVPTNPLPSPTGTPSSPQPTYSPSPSASPSPTKSPPPPAHPPGGAYTQVVNLASGRCLDIDNGDLEKGTDVITAPCTSSRTQRWRVDADEGALRSYADPDFCLDSRGATDDGVGIWECASLNGHNGPNLRFAVTSKGALRPAIAPDHALTPTGNNTLDLAPDTGGTIQRWRAGAS